MTKYNIYLICKDEEIFLEKKKQFDKYKSKVCHIQWIPAEFLTLTQCNKAMLKKLNTMYNTKDKSIIAKLGCIAAHRKALLAIYSNQTKNNLILEEDATLSGPLPPVPDESCYMGGWIVPPQISKTGKVKINIKPKKGLNKINYEKYKIITTHALFIKKIDKATEMLDSTIKPERLKNYDVHLADNKYFTYFYYPPTFIQGKHVSDIDGKVNKNDQRTMNYGL
jgi:hypothetical protein|tara:strand:+ start:2301 stop:2969 length:669 start_codon:yes stop_codon:yes gene_type:complete